LFHIQPDDPPRRGCAPTEGVMSKRSRKKKSRRLPPLLMRLIWAAKQVKEDAGGADISHIPDALKEFGAMAQWGVPAHGAFVATQPDIEVIIGRAAKLRFGGGDAKREFDEAVRIIEEFDKRDAIETAMNGVRAADSDAYFYAGMAWGITLACLPGGR
jgi:hypothetical protein